MSSRLLVSIGVLLAGLLVPVVLAAQTKPAAKPKNVVPFKITAQTMTVDMNQQPKMLVYEGNVRFKSPLRDTLITCDRLRTDSSTANAVTAVEASGKVNLSMTIPPKKAGDPTNHIEGHSELLRYTMLEKQRVVRLLMVKEVMPTLTVTDLANKEAPYTLTGEVIEYNLDLHTLTVQNVSLENKGNAQ